jgi:hypothetical protein
MNPKCAFDIRSATIGRKLDLGSGRTMPDEGVYDRRPEVARDFACLIEAPLILTAPVERDRHDAFHVIDELRSTLAHSFGQRARQRLPARIFERVNDLSQRTFVLPDRTRSIDRALSVAALQANRGSGIRD